MGEFCALVDGGLTEIIGGTTVSYSDHEVSYKPPGVAHQVQVPRGGARCVVVSIPASRCAFAPDVRQLAGPALYSDPQFSDLFGRMFRELQATDDCGPLALEAIALTMLARTIDLQRIDRQSQAPAWMGPVIERLHDDWSRRPLLGELARLAGVSATHLASTFQRFCGCSIGEYLRRLRVAHARQLLAVGDRPLAEVAYQCGFYDQSHFTNLFRRYIGSTPARFRQSFTPPTPPSP